MIGSGGYIGKELKQYLTESKFNVLSVSSNNRINYDNFIEELRIKKYRHIDFVFFLSGADEKKSKNFKYSINIKKNILKKILKLTKFINIKKIIYFSSVKVYSEKITGEVKENTKLFSKSNYSIAHLYSEKFLFEKFDKNKILILRLSNLYGFNNNSIKGNKYFLNYLLKSINNSNDILIKTKFNFYRDYISIDYFLNFIGIILSNKININIVNVCSGKMTSVIEILKKIKSIKNKKKLNLNIKSNIVNNEKNKFFYSTNKLYKIYSKKYLRLHLQKYINV